MFQENETCRICGKPVNSENGIQVSTVLWETKKEDGGLKSWGEDMDNFCSHECLFKWTWGMMIPNSLLYNVEHPKSVIDLAAELTWKDVAKKRVELLKLIDVHVPK